MLKKMREDILGGLLLGATVEIWEWRDVCEAFRGCEKKRRVSIVLICW